jgi:hypothetical protein
MLAAPAEEAAAAPEAPEVAPVEAEAPAEELPADCVDIDFKIEHPLLREWVMWYDNPGLFDMYLCAPCSRSG